MTPAEKQQQLIEHINSELSTDDPKYFNLFTKSREYALFLLKQQMPEKMIDQFIKLVRNNAVQIEEGSKPSAQRHKAADQSKASKPDSDSG